MIDPSNITNYNLSGSELEEHLLFWICAAGKNGTTAARCLDKFLKSFRGLDTPFNTVFRVHSLYGLPETLKSFGIGCYNHKARSFYEVSVAGLRGELDLKTCTTDDLEKIYGIGMKTSRCFILHSRKDARVAGLDTHILKHLRACGVKDVPKTTPSSKKEYKRLENEFLKMVEDSGKSVAEYDLMVWNKYAVKARL